MSLSLGEFEALCRKAARGAGFDWGLAEEAGRAARRLETFALPGADALVARLASPDAQVLPARGLMPRTSTGVWTGDAGRLCPVLAGAALSDAPWRLVGRETEERGREDLFLRNVLTPLLLVPFAGLAARQIGAAVSMAWGSVVITDDGRSLWLDGAREAILDDVADVVRCRVRDTADLAPDSALSRAERVRSDPLCRERLEAFAQRTYAPATEESRRRGAG